MALWVDLILVTVMTVAFMHVCRKVAPHVGLLDKPLEDRKKHVRVTPTVGGVAIFTVFSASLFLFSDLTVSLFLPLLIGMFGFIAIGVYDDIKHIRPMIKMLWQILVAIAVVFFADIKVKVLGDLFGMGNVKPGLLAIPFTILCVVVLINAINWIDGLDGLAGGTLLTMFVLLAIASSTTMITPLIFILGATLFGFLMFNMRSPWRDKALVFLGDAGSLALGFALSWVVIYLTQIGGVEQLSPIVAAWIIAYPVFDMISSMLIRKLNGKVIYHADNVHAHFLIQTLGFSVGKTTSLLICLSVVYGLIGIGGEKLGLPESVLALTWCIAMVGHFAVMRMIYIRSSKKTISISKESEIKL